jgi:site-specific DNA recombinase
LKQAADTIDIGERQKIVRLLVKEVLVDDAAIVIRHSIPVQQSPSGDPKPSMQEGKGPAGNKNYLLRSVRGRTLTRYGRT